MNQDDKPNPWDKLQHESSKAYAAFQAYLGLGPKRSIDKAYARQNPDKTKPKRGGAVSWWEWSSGNRWVERASAYDEHLFQLELSGRERVVEEARQLAVKRASDLMEILVHLAEGECESEAVQLQALRLVLSIAGLGPLTQDDTETKAIEARREEENKKRSRILDLLNHPDQKVRDAFRVVARAQANAQRT